MQLLTRGVTFYQLNAKSYRSSGRILEFSVKTTINNCLVRCKRFANKKVRSKRLQSAVALTSCLNVVMAC